MLRNFSAVVCLALPLLTACVPPALTSQESSTTTSLANDLPFKSVSNGYYQGVSKKQLIVAQTSAELTAALADITLMGVAPSADFSTQTLIGVLINTPVSACESVNISAITDDTDHLTVNANFEPAQNSTGPNACVAVFHNGVYTFVTIAKITKPVTLVTRGDVHFDVVAKGIYGDKSTPKKYQLVIQTEAELADALTGVMLGGQPLRADFSTQTLIGVLVADSSACGETVLTKITDDGAGLTVNANHVSHPTTPCIAVMVGGSYAFVTIPKTAKPVTFVVTDVVAAN